MFKFLFLLLTLSVGAHAAEIDSLTIDNSLILLYGTPSTALTLDSSGNIVSSSVTSTELSYVHGSTSNLQSQINAKQNALTFSNSLVNNSGTVSLVGDTASPGNTRYYGTDGSGNRGFFSIPAGGVTSVTASSPLVSSGGATPNLTIPPATNSVPGYLTSGDHASFVANIGATATAQSTANTAQSSADSANSNANSRVSRAGDTMTGLLTVPNLIDTGLTGNTVPFVNAFGQLISSSVTPTQLSYVDATSSIQTQLNSKQTTVSFGSFGSTPNDNGGSISGGVVTLQPADATHPGGITSGAQTIGGAKNFSGAIVYNGSAQVQGNLNVLGASFLDNSQIATDGSGNIDVGGTGSFIGDQLIIDTSETWTGNSNPTINVDNAPDQVLVVNDSLWVGSEFKAAFGDFDVDTSGNVTAAGTASFIGTQLIIDNSETTTGDHNPTFNLDNAPDQSLVVSGLLFVRSSFSAADGGFNVDSEGNVQAQSTQINGDGTIIGEAYIDSQMFDQNQVQFANPQTRTFQDFNGSDVLTLDDGSQNVLINPVRTTTIGSTNVFGMGPTLLVSAPGLNPGQTAFQINIDGTSVFNIDDQAVVNASSIATDKYSDSNGNQIIDASDEGAYDGIPLFTNGLRISTPSAITWTSGGSISSDSLTSGLNLLNSGAINITGSSVNISPAATVPSLFRTATQTTVNCSTSGNVVFSQPDKGSSVKMVVAKVAACLGTASYTFPTAFLGTPVVRTTSGPAASVVTSLSTSAMTITGASTTGPIFIDGI